MRLLVLGGTLFLGRHVVAAALARGHDVATFTRGVTGSPPDGVRALHGDRDDPGVLPAALGEWRPELVVDTSCQSRAAARHAAAVLGDVRGYAFVSSLNAYRNWPPGPVRSEDDPVWQTDDDEYGPIKAAAERELGAVLGDRFLTARAGLIVGPHDTVDRLGWWLRRIARGGRVAVPDALEQPLAVVDARDLAGWLVEMAERGVGGPVTATGPVGMTTLGGLLAVCREVTGSDAALVPVPEEELLAAGVEPWQDLPLWLPQDVAATAWAVDTTRARRLGLPVRPVRESVADTWAWLRDAGELPAPPHGRPRPGLDPGREARLLAGH
ncbi:NAD-dependent epimerase/dehydratase family protein [Trujillonella endophytica]|uniref:Nucleoside-diphosphate-sugar epimerase n=1 Tax=Trujillonella endophytica TaxID=673521 RepID=A0A1H8UW00_9ACTN|nr:NAD-dependent epimerase/dehydratase family protein [Trujillella endophytica]SEP07331.1 Nucleoside-diphosphate-sugar epimerase [Trujillella endophytica]